ncbi:ClpXP protease specificity-enhancing factor SspB [Methylobacterium sp. J-072]|uniref:SspB family protein n=1 Tax=Methylobacterium sp. J-072 TaxID=2836651 RepID=UPI001FBAA1E7|nr:ClpXP protease specificity-enhancing factor SspB [Methylobacterium sp. J-072]MCJ2092857.1 ClpXP protease specificity-enhancing factor SspB [Methylobacterium sp. J-072]
MADDLIRYDLLVQDALRGVVRKVLTDAARDGLMGDHHFYVSFRTEAPGVRMSQALREKYPQDMTIVLQHQFWDLSVHEHTFEVGLSFSGVPERLLVPFDALSGFFDPSVQFGLKFDLTEAGEVPEEANAAPAKAGPRGAGSEPSEVRPKGAGLATIGSAAPKVLPAPAAQGDKPPGAKPEEKAPRPAAKKDGEEGSAEVVSLDAFRKKS